LETKEATGVTSFVLITWVAGLGVAPSLGDYEPPVQLEKGGKGREKKEEGIN
jgi:hypothetical protein